MSTLPIDFIKRIESDAFVPENLLEALEKQAPTSVRLHPRRKHALSSNSPVLWNNVGIYLTERPRFTYDPYFHAGAYYPQEAGSMYLQQALEALCLPEDPVCLDLSAAPGGKSTLLAAFLKQRGLLIANEIIRSRAHILAENLSKWGYSNTFVCNHSPKELFGLRGKIDVLLLDAPCSGEGMFRKDMAARTEWTATAAKNCAIRQAEILEDAWPLIKEKGYLIYATCTFNPEENEYLLRNFLAQEVALPIPLPLFEGMKQDREKIGAYFFPGSTQSEGFYIAVVQKLSHEPQKIKGKLQKSNNQLNPAGPIAQQLPITTRCAHDFWIENEHLHATTPFALAFYKQLPLLNWLKKGLHTAQQFKKNWSPAYDMVYSLDLSWELPELHVEKEQALQILHGESQVCNKPAGHYFISFDGVKIAMVKQLGQRFNNLHPTAWRIRHLPKPHQ